MNLRTIVALLSTAGLLLVGVASTTVASPAVGQEGGSTTTQLGDGWITTKITSQFVNVDVLEGSNIAVETNQGVVTLSGTVPTKAGRMRALAIARQTDGVKNVVDKMTIGAAAAGEGTGAALGRAGDRAQEQMKETAQDAKQTGQSAGTAINDGWITTKIKTKFVPEDALEGSNIAVDTNNGVVTLSGSVLSDAGRKRAIEIARTTDGVRQVVDKMKIGSTDTAHGIDDKAERAVERTTERAADTAERAGTAVNDSWITAKVKSQFIGVDVLDGSDINVETNSGVVTLTGTVRTAAGKARAESITKTIDGVKSVQNRLMVGEPK